MRFEKLKNKGAAIILIAGIIVGFLLLFFVVAIDFSRMYYVRGELQNAADAGALAGATLLDGTNETSQPTVRDAAKKFTELNNAAGQAVGAELNSGNDDLGDIVLGNWNPVLDPTFLSTRTPVNAVKVVARRTSAISRPGISVGNNPVALLFGRLIDWTVMSVTRTAIAARTEVPVLPLPLCLPQCNTDTPYTPSCPGKKFVFNPPKAENVCGVAWANMDTSSTHQPTQKMIEEYLAFPSFVNVCDHCLKTKQGSMEASLSDLETAFNKRKQPYSLPGLSAPVTGWRVLIPILTVGGTCGGGGPKPCPGDQPNPYNVTNMAEVLITSVDPPPADACDTCEKKKQVGVTLLGLGSSTTPNSTKIECVPCSIFSSSDYEAKPKLVK